MYMGTRSLLFGSLGQQAYCLWSEVGGLGGMLLAGLPGWVDLPVELCIQARLLGGLPG